MCVCTWFDRLQHEINEILDSISALQDRLRHADQAMARLQKTRTTLQQDIAVKDNSLSIDAKACMGMRKNLASDAKAVGPIYSLPSAAY
jgi:predicted  nucleic acid-binding Zn-ribbon protein